MNKIKVLLYAVLTLVLGMALSSCSDDDGIPTVTPSFSGTFTDADGTVYHWVRIGTLDWMVENYKGGDAWYTQSYVTNRYEERFSVDDEKAEDALIAQQGNYFTWQQAKDCAPEGWRLPTDADYQNLEETLGMSASDASKEGWRNGAGTLMMQKGTGTQLAFLLTGEIGTVSTGSPERYHVGDYGCYWTATLDSTKANACAYIRVIVANRNMVQRVPCPTGLSCMSVRYVRDAK